MILRHSVSMAARPGDLYEAIVDDGAFASLPELIADIVGGRSCVIHRFDPAMNLIGFQKSYFTDDLIMDLGAAHPDGLDIWTGTGFACGLRNQPVPLTSLISEEEFQRSALWNEVFRANGDDTGQSLGQIQTVGDEMICLSVHRPKTEQAFGRAECERLDAVSADLHRIFRARFVIADHDRKVDRLNRLLEGSGSNVMLVGPGLTLIEASPAAAAMLSARDGVSSFGGRLQFSDSRIGSAVAQAVTATINRAPVRRSTFICRRPSDLPGWRLTVLPHVHDGETGGATGCVLRIHEPRLDEDRVRTWLTSCYGATAAEVRVATALLVGMAPEEIAEQRGVSLNTVRTQVRRLLDKTGMRRVSELLLLLASLR
jgi:DNA-binding CsgD family transcriptional regulator